MFQGCGYFLTAVLMLCSAQSAASASNASNSTEGPIGQYTREVDRLGSNSNEEATRAGDTISKLGPTVIPLLMKRISQNRISPQFDGQFDYYAVYAIQEMGPQANDALEGILRSKDHQLRMDTMDVIQTLPARHNLLTAEIVDLLVSGLSDPNPGIRLHAARALGGLGPRNLKVVQAVQSRAQKEPDAAARAALAKSLGAIGRRESPRARAITLSILGPMKDDPDADVRMEASQSFAAVKDAP